MKMHPREKKIDEAESILNKAILDVMELDLTNAEYLSVIGSVFGGAITSRTKYMIRYERHGDAEKPGGLA